MSEEPPHHPPPLPPQVLYCQQPVQPALPIGVQALLGCLATAPAVFVIVCLLIGMDASLTGSSDAANIAIVSATIIFGLGILAAILYWARRLRKNELRRGWAIGIYIGLGLSALFWGTCGLILVSLSGANFH